MISSKKERQRYVALAVPSRVHKGKMSSSVKLFVMFMEWGWHVYGFNGTVERLSLALSISGFEALRNVFSAVSSCHSHCHVIESFLTLYAYADKNIDVTRIMT